MLELIIHEKNVETVNEEKFIRGTVGAKCKITFDEFWQNYEKTVVFKNNDFSNPPKKVFVSETVNVIEIPPEILAKLGYFVIGAYGIIEDEKLPTLYSEEFDVVYGTDTECVEPESYTPNEIEQLRLLKQDKLTPGDNITIDENNVISATGDGGTGGGTTDYEQLDNKPKINGIELVGNKTTSDLAIKIPTKLSELTNDKGYIDNTALDDYYTKAEINTLIGDIETALDNIIAIQEELIGGDSV